MKTPFSQMFFGLTLLITGGAAQTAAAGPQLFPPNHLFATSYGTHDVFEFAEDGTFLQTFSGSGALNGPEGIAFGPDGLLYVASWQDGEVFAIDATDTVQTGFDASGTLLGPMGVAFGPLGNLYVTSSISDQVYILNQVDFVLDTLGAGTTLSGPRGVTFSPDGTLYVVSRGTDEVLPFGPDGTPLPAYAIPGLSSPYGINFSPGGMMIVGSGANDALVFGGKDPVAINSSLADVLLDTPYGVVVGPDGLVWAASDNNSRVVAFDGPTVTREAGVGVGMAGLGGVAFSPFVFRVKISGRVEAPDGDSFKLSGKGKLLWSPGSCRLMLKIDTGTDLSSTLGGATIVMHGQEAGTGKQRAITVTEVPRIEKYFRVTTSTLKASGKLDSSGFFVPKEISGAFSRTGLVEGGHVFRGKIQTLKRLN